MVFRIFSAANATTRTERVLNTILDFVAECPALQLIRPGLSSLREEPRHKVRLSECLLRRTQVVRLWIFLVFNTRTCPFERCNKLA